MFCKKCGKPLEGNETFCTYCGDKVETDDLAPGAEEEGKDSRQAAEGLGSHPPYIGPPKAAPAPGGGPQKKGFNYLKAMWIALVPIVSAVVIAGAVFVSIGIRNHKNNAKPPQGYTKEAGGAQGAQEEARGAQGAQEAATKALPGPLAEVPDPAGEPDPDLSAVLAAYQQYADGLKGHEPLQYTMFYLNDDKVPECFIWDDYDCHILSYVNNAVISFVPHEETTATGPTQRFYYTPRSGRLMENHGSGASGEAWYLLTLDRSFTETAYAEIFGWNDMERKQRMVSYTINNKEVTYEELAEATDESAYEVVLERGASKDIYDSILKAYNALTSPGQPAGQEVSEFILPESNIRYMTYHDLKGLDAANLRIAKNEIYARHGRTFQSEDLNQYFNSKSWYSGTISPDHFTEGVFNDFESGNIGILQYFQDGTPDGHYYAYSFQYQYFKTDSGVLTVVAEPTKWSGGQEGYALSLPISDHCSWWLELDQTPYTGGEAGLLRTISDERAWYLESPDNFQSPTGISVEVQGGVVVMIKVYIS